MILKDKSPQKALSPSTKAGLKQEQDVAFFLRREFKNNNNVLVINDYKFSFEGETAQIDHLIIYPYGFILIESKSIKGEVKVNAFGEWIRSYNNKWAGMPSPIKQLELQQKLLRELLYANRDKILGKILGLKQQGFSGRCWDNICAVSSNAVIDRNDIEKSISNQLVKSEFLVDKLNDIMKLKNSTMNKLNPFDIRPDFSDDELESISSFLMKYISDDSNLNTVQEEKVNYVVSAEIQKVKILKQKVSCKFCGESSAYETLSGRYGYFIKCNKCKKNTPLKQACFSCESKNTKVSKNKGSYSLICTDCGLTEVLIY